MAEQSHTYNEIISQPAVWAATAGYIAGQAGAARQAWDRIQPENLLFIGCGSTYYLSRIAAALFQELTGLPARAVPASELLLFPEQVLANPAQTLLVAISRSGTTTETLLAVERYREAGGPAVWAITCYPDRDLATTADLAFVAEAAQETSVVQTRSFSSMLVMVQGLAAALAGEDAGVLRLLPEMAQTVLDETMTTMESLGHRPDLERFFFLGSGLQYGLANEGMLKIKEMSLSHSEAYHFLEFRHGPMSLVGPESLVAGLLSAEAYASERQVLEEMVQLGATVAAITPSEPVDGAAHSVQLPPSLPAWARLPLYLPPLQLLAYYRTRSRNLDPDKPRNLGAVVRLDPAEFQQRSAAR